MPTDKRRFPLMVEPRVFAAVGLDPESAGSPDVTGVLKKYGGLLIDAGREVERKLSRDEWNYLADACNGLIWDGVDPVELLKLQAHDAIPDLATKWLGEDAGESAADYLVAKLGKLTPLQAEAAALAIRWFWTRGDIDLTEDRWWSPTFRVKRTTGR